MGKVRKNLHTLRKFLRSGFGSLASQGVDRHWAGFADFLLCKILRSRPACQCPWSDCSGRQVYANNRPHKMTLTHSSIDTSAWNLASAGAVVSVFQRSTER